MIPKPIPKDRLVMPKDNKDAARFLLQAIEGTDMKINSDGQYHMSVSLTNRVIHYLEGKPS